MIGTEGNGESLLLHRREVSFRLPSAPEGVEVLILTTPEGAQALACGKAKVSRKKVVAGKKKHQQDIVTREQVLGYGGAWHKLVYPRWADHGL